MTVDDCRLIELKSIRFREGNITPIEGNADVPFEIRRVFYIYDIPGGEQRGAHAHKTCHQFIIAASGSFEVVVDDGTNQRTILLNRPFYGLHVPPGIWCHEQGFSSGSVCLVLTSALYDEDDYIRDYAKYLSQVKGISAENRRILPVDLKKATDLHSAEIHDAAKRVIDSGWYLLGKEVKSFEENYARFIGTKYCVGVGNGLDALRLIIRAYKQMGVMHEGDEIIVPANTYIASILAVTENNLVPVLVEPDPETLEIDDSKIEEAITSKTRGIMIVHLYGRNSYTRKIGEICHRYSLKLIEDNAQAHGCYYKPEDECKMQKNERGIPKKRISGEASHLDFRHESNLNRIINLSQESDLDQESEIPFAGETCIRTGSIGDAAGHSFYPTKNLGALGDAGAVTTNDENLAAMVRALANYGSSRKYVFPYEGINSRLDEMQAAILNAKLQHLEEENAKRKDVARKYIEGIDNPEIWIPGYSSRVSSKLAKDAKDANDESCINRLLDSSVWHLFPIMTKHRDELQRYLAGNNVLTQIHYPIPPHKQDCFKESKILSVSNWHELRLPITERIHNEELSLPVSPTLTAEEQSIIIDLLNRWTPKSGN